MSIFFESDNDALQTAFASAISHLSKNIQPIYTYPHPVLIEGAEYRGVWLECAPLEGLIYSAIDPQIALNNHKIFFHYQREDGYLPCWVWSEDTGTGQIQMVVPIAATALELYEQIGDVAFLEQAYNACSKWDDWLMLYRNTRGTGLCEAFCEFDTGHDTSPRFRGLPQECPERDARLCPPVGNLPYLAPDLSATVYGGRVALAKMAALLGRTKEAAEWDAKAVMIRNAILKHTFDWESMCFYDVDSQGNFVRVRGDAMIRVLGEHVVEQALFEKIYARQIKNPNAFWTPFPLPSIAADDPEFIHELPPNSWGGAAQALTALRASRWFEYYGKFADLQHLMVQWLSALTQAHAAGHFWFQQMNPCTGEFTPSKPGYSPAMLVMIDFVTRLYGVRRQGNTLTWGGGLPINASSSRFVYEDNHGKFEALSDGNQRILSINGKQIYKGIGRFRLVTDLRGHIR